jgi:hypothetical protein
MATEVSEDHLERSSESSRSLGFAACAPRHCKTAHDAKGRLLVRLDRDKHIGSLARSAVCAQLHVARVAADPL